MNKRLAMCIGAAFALVAVGALVFQYWSTWSSVRRAESACANRNWSQAIRILEPFLARYPDHWEARLVLARAQFGQGDWRDGMESLRQIPEGSPYVAAAKFYEGSALLDVARGAQAESALLACLSLDPESIPARQQLVALYLWEDRRLEARRLAWEVYDRAPPEHRADALSQLFHVDYGEFPLADRRSRLERFVAQNPHDWDAAAALAGIYSTDADLATRARAMPMFLEALQQQPDNVAARMALIGNAVGDDHDQARQLLDGWPTESRDERYFSTRGIVQQECDLDFEHAAESYRRVLESQPDHWKVRGRLAVCLRMLNQPEQANLQMKRQARVSEALKEDFIRELLESQQTQLGTATLRYQLGKLYEKVGRFKEARCWYQQALEVQPMHAATQEAWAELSDKPDVQPVDDP